MLKNLVTKIFQRLPMDDFFSTNDSITKKTTSQPYNPHNYQFEAPKAILSILESTNFIKLCGYLAIFYTLIGVSMQSPYVHNVTHLTTIITETLVSSLIIILTIVWFIRSFMQNIENKPYTQQQVYQYLILSMLLIVPSMSLFSRLIIYLFFNIKLTWIQLIIEAIANTLMVLAMLYIVLNYIKHQYITLKETERQHHKKLLEENEQLKARTSPHFFFNMLNTMQSLVESDPEESSDLLNRIATLYRASFAETKEVSMLEEIEICKDYLKIELYRFNHRLVVTWDVPEDEEILYDMSITSLMLQMTIEKMILYVVEMTSDTIYLYIKIRWENDWAKIHCITNIPEQAYLKIINELQDRLSYDKQTEILQFYYGAEASITSYYTHDKIETVITYPLKDIAYS